MPGTYDEHSVQRGMWLLQALHRWGVSGAFYTLMAFIMMPVYTFVLAFCNRLEVIGRENFPEGRGVFVISNHQSMWDGQIIGTLLFPKAFWFPSKAEFFPNLAGSLLFMTLTAFRGFPVRRGERDLRAIRFMESLLRDGHNILIFPEGTRSRDGSLGEGKPGVGALIVQTKPTVVPIYLEGFHRVRGLRLFGNRLKVVVGTPVDLCEGIDAIDQRQARRIVATRAMEAIAALREKGSS